MKRVFVVFGTRPEAIKLLPVIKRFRQMPEIELVTCSTAQHRDLLDQMLSSDGWKPDIDLNVMKPGQSLSDLTGWVLGGVARELERVKPDLVIVQGDTTTAMASALAAFYLKIPVAHVESGLRSNDIYAPWPEEVNRKIISQIAVLHFAPTEQAAGELRRENIPENRILVTGNTVIDALLHVREFSRSDAKLQQLASRMSSRFEGRRIILVTCHRRENFGEGIPSIAHAILDIAARGDVGILFPLHPNPNVKDTMNALLGGHPAIELMPALDYPSFVTLLDLAYLVLTDSGGVQEEAPALGKPVLVLRETTERPEGLAAGTARLVGTDRQKIVTEVSRLLDDAETYSRMSKAHNPYGDGRASERIGAAVTEFFGAAVKN